MILFPWFQAEIWVTVVSAFPFCYAGKESVTWARSWRLKSSKRLSWSNKISHCRAGLPGSCCLKDRLRSLCFLGRCWVTTQGSQHSHWREGLTANPSWFEHWDEHAGTRGVLLSAEAVLWHPPLQMGSKTAVSPIPNGMG